MEPVGHKCTCFPPEIVKVSAALLQVTCEKCMRVREEEKVAWSSGLVKGVSAEEAGFRRE